MLLFRHKIYEQAAHSYANIANYTKSRHNRMHMMNQSDSGNSIPTSAHNCMPALRALIESQPLVTSSYTQCQNNENIGPLKLKSLENMPTSYYVLMTRWSCLSTAACFKLGLI